MSKLCLTNLTKRFGPVTAVDRINLNVADGEFVTLLGPSGCGKTTTLRMVAGFIRPDAGEISVDDRVLASSTSRFFVAPEDRHMSMVFQNYALWPHMTAIENVMFGLRTRGVSKRQARAKAMEALAMVSLNEMAKRFPHQLSGGQQQRISLARALACEPSVLLMDEPLSNLDAKFRESMRFEIKELQRKLGITCIYVTHDQAEAIVMSDQICVMWGGRIVQKAPPREIYERPICTEVANFVGQTNFLCGRAINKRGRELRIETKWGHLTLAGIKREIVPGQKVTVSIRPERIRLSKSDTVDLNEDNVVLGRIAEKIFLGNFQEYWIDLEGENLRVQGAVTDDLAAGDAVVVGFDPDWVTVIEE